MIEDSNIKHGDDIWDIKFPLGIFWEWGQRNEWYKWTVCLFVCLYLYTCCVDTTVYRPHPLWVWLSSNSSTQPSYMTTPPFHDFLVGRKTYIYLHHQQSHPHGLQTTANILNWAVETKPTNRSLIFRPPNKMNKSSKCSSFIYESPNPLEDVIVCVSWQSSLEWTFVVTLFCVCVISAISLVETS